MFLQKLYEARVQCDKLVTEYTQLAGSLRRGEALYTLDEGNDKRVQLIKQFKIVDTFRYLTFKQ